MNGACVEALNRHLTYIKKLIVWILLWKCELPQKKWELSVFESSFTSSLFPIAARYQIHNSYTRYESVHDISNKHEWCCCLVISKLMNESIPVARLLLPPHLNISSLSHSLLPSFHINVGGYIEDFFNIHIIYIHRDKYLEIESSFFHSFLSLIETHSEESSFRWGQFDLVPRHTVRNGCRNERPTTATTKKSSAFILFELLLVLPDWKFSLLSRAWVSASCPFDGNKSHTV